MDWGAYSPVHAYTVDLKVAEALAEQAVFDGNSNPPPELMAWYGDNSGSLNFAITYVGP